MCFGMPVFADRWRGDRLISLSMFLNVVRNVVVFFVISTNATDDDVNVIWDWLFIICWLFKTTCITFASDNNDFTFSKPNNSRQINRSKSYCRRRFNEFENFLFDVFKNRSLDFTIADLLYFKYFSFCSCFIQFVKNEEISEIYKRNY